MPVLDVGGETLHYEAAGDGPAMLLVHSLGTGAWLWKAQLRHWAASRRVVAADARGHGGSSWRGGITMEGNAQDLAALMASQDLRDAIVVGISMGGVIATHLAHIAPQRVRALVLADSFCHQADGAARIAGIESRLASMDMPSFARAYAAETLMPASHAAQRDALAEGIGRTGKDAYLATARALFLEDTRPLLARLRQPTLVLWGAQDQRTPKALSEQILQSMPHARLEELADAAHLSNLDQPQAFQAAIDRFAAGLP